MPFYQLSCGTGQRTYGALSKQQLVEFMWGEEGRDWQWLKPDTVQVFSRTEGHSKTYTVKAVPQAVYDHARDAEGRQFDHQFDIRDQERHARTAV